MLNRFSLRQWLIGGCAIWCFTVGMLARAEVVLDGTLGPGGALPGPEYMIGAELGERHGGNLFHSFQDFNLNSSESATFLGPNSINNIISRVTGGNPSSIDGLIKSNIPADMYFLNPHGIMFKPNAKLDVQGSFYASTADYLRLRNGGRFDARNPSDSLLTVAPVEAFGFLGSSAPKTISVEGGLEVSGRKTLSLIGGDITIEGDGTVPNLSAPSGGINLISVASEGEVSGESDGYFVDVSSFTKLAKIYIGNGLIQTNNAVDTNTNAIGINVKAGQLTLNDGRLVAETDGVRKGGDITIDVTGKVKLEGTKMFNESTGILNTLISTRTQSKSENAGIGGKIELNVGELEVTGGRHIGSLTDGNGDGGDIDIVADQLTLNNGKLVTETRGTGKGGDINIVTDTANIYSDKPLSEEDYNYSLHELISTYTRHSGIGGNINMNVRQLHINNARQVVALTFTDGQGGNIDITATEDITIENGFFLDENIGLVASQIAAQAGPTSDGKAGSIGIKSAQNIVLRENAIINSSSLGNGGSGNINLNARQLKITDGGQIASATFGSGNAGDVNATITENISIFGKGFSDGMPNGIFSSSDQLPEPFSNPILGNAGEIKINTDELIMRGSGPLEIDELITHIYPLELEIIGNRLGKATAMLGASTVLGDGNGGKVKVKARKIELKHGSAIYAMSILGAKGNAGDVELDVKDSLRMQNGSLIWTTAEGVKGSGGGNISINSPGYLYLTDSGLSTSVFADNGDGGNIILKPEFLVLDNSSILARAYEGSGGNINITTTNIYEFSKNVINASSYLGKSGEVIVVSPDVNIEEKIPSLKDSLSLGNLSMNRCTIHNHEDSSSFVIITRDKLPETPLDLRTHVIFTDY